jgi:hypothetical protein
MKTKQEIIEILKEEYPSLRVGSDNDGYVELSADEYEATIDDWADKRLAKLSKAAEAEAKATQKAALLERLGISEDEAKLLLA